MLIVLAACILVDIYVDCAAAALVPHVSALPGTLLTHVASCLLPNIRKKNVVACVFSGFDMF